MFVTFAASSPMHCDQDPEKRAPKPKRAPVTRACSWCRLNRVRCDNYHPCRNCRHRKGKCHRDHTAEVATLPSVLKENQALKLRISHLETQIRDRTSSEPLPRNWQRPYLSLGPATDIRRGLVVTNDIGGTPQLYGFSSLRCLSSRITLQLRSVYGWRYSDLDIQCQTAGSPFAWPTNIVSSNASGSPLSQEELTNGAYMTREQEDGCLRLFWQTYHCTVPILDERAFKEHHASIWAGRPADSRIRENSPLVDIVLAVCIQYGMTLVPRENTSGCLDADINTTDASNAGRWYFQRSQSLLSAYLENPSVMLLQCQIISIIYLRDASFSNMASSAAAAAVQTVYALGFHLDFNGDYCRKEREFHKRLWCMTYALESKISMDLGRPFVTRELNVCLPSDDPELASISSTMFTQPSKLGIRWLSYHVHHVDLIRVARGIYSNLEDNRAYELATNGGKEFYDDPQTMENCSKFLTQQISILLSWLQSVPDILICRRKCSGRSFSTDGSALDIDRCAPSWLQMQIFTLELIYHDTIINFCRPFISFQANSRTSTPLSDETAAICLKHAITVTDIVHQVLEETETLYGWHRAYQFQWNATLSMIGFAFGYQESPLVPSALMGIKKAISVFDMFDNNFAAAACVGRITRDLFSMLNQVLKLL
ncbi:uncharacterized protein TRUGW13939_04934 [Talaromyces rugulosus]|uniref:Zn(2)-C6 fungal-type domain-containing protein n=1 Tax=Talaromyces rugulosus TaxID=121627 RepID=A0A7H8QUX3_TALRU|nr:uncharacterized protein TRUGW13939_04934 [Talaromyces rugulosus]QKX57814.1 hypothetical protein TRUGW13939_04934 [Talaromyces rugulosus]